MDAIGFKSCHTGDFNAREQSVLRHNHRQVFPFVRIEKKVKVYFLNARFHWLLFTTFKM